MAYKPNQLNKLIVFEERQVAEAEVALKWDNSSAVGNSEGPMLGPGFTSALAGSTCNVTIYDPYLTGIAWPVLYDAASLYMSNESSARTGLLLPPCGEGENPIRNKCRRLVDIDDTGQSLGGGMDSYPHLMVSMWYDVKGTRFGTDFYFRVTKMSIIHGSQFPSVQIQGLESRSIIFNQNLVNYGFPAGTSMEDAIKKIVSDHGYTPSFCYADYSKYKLLQPSATRETGVTGHEAIKRRLNASGGNLTSMPTRDWKDTISICTRNEVNQGCKVFYLGVGLYEGYTLDGIPNAQFAANLENNFSSGSAVNDSSIYTYPAFISDEYELNEALFKRLREEKLRSAKRKAFPKLFESISKRFESTQATISNYWEGSGPKVKNKLGQDLNFYGISPNGTDSIAYLDGVLNLADEQNGEVLIKTNYFIYACGVEKGTTTRKCFSRPIYQQVLGLTNVKVKKLETSQPTLISINQVLGTSTQDRPDLVRFFIQAQDIGDIVLSPEIVFKYAIPTQGLTEEERRRYIGQRSVTGTTGGVTYPNLSNRANYGEITATTTQNAKKIVLMAGHADLRSSGQLRSNLNETDVNIKALEWVKNNLSKYGLEGVVEVYLPSSNNVVRNEDSPQWKKISQSVAQDYQVIELHHDQPDGGMSGVIPPLEGKTRRPLDATLSKIYGSFGNNWRRDGAELGAPARGGTIVELAALSPENAARALSPDPTVREAYYSQALSPLLQAIRNQYSVNGRVTTPAASSVQNNTSPLYVAQIGSTGQSTGPHLHAEWLCNRNRCSSGNPKPITKEDVDRYVQIGGKKASQGAVLSSDYGQQPNRFHFGIDFATNEGVPIDIIGGATVVDVMIRSSANGDGRGYGNNIVIRVPDGREMILAHLKDGSINKDLILGRTGGGGAGSPNSGAGRTDTGTVTGPTTNGLTVSTSFKGVPRALRIIPGRTILSFVTEYDKWLELSREEKRTLDPGVWIPDRFSKYFITQATFTWKQGDLRVNLQGVMDWGLTKITSPSFNTYLEQMRKYGSSGMKNYFDYIRSLGDLCYMIGKKNSCEEKCKEIQDIANFLNLSQQQASSSPEVTTSYAPANCRYNGSLFSDRTQVMNEVIKALNSVGVNTPNGYAGVLGNAQQESTLNPLIHTTSARGRGCTATDSPAYGLFQWCYDRQDKIRQKCGERGTLQCQLQHTLEELSMSTYKPVISKLNSSQTPEEAAFWWNKIFEVGTGVGLRQGYAKQIAAGLKCSR